MSESELPDDNLIRSLCFDNNKTALAMIFDRHAKHVYIFVMSWLQIRSSRTHVVQKNAKQKLARMVVTKVFAGLWDGRDTLMDRIDEIRLRMINRTPTTDRDKILILQVKQRSLRQYLLLQAKRKISAIPKSSDKETQRKSSIQ